MRILTVKLSNKSLEEILIAKISKQWEYLHQKYQSDNANKIIVSQDFDGNKYIKNI